MRTKLIYLASPYSHPSEVVREHRYYRICSLAAAILNRCPDVSVFGPISQSHGIAKHLPDELNCSDFWLPIDFTVLDRCDEVWVAQTMEGWAESGGVNAEIERANALGIPVRAVREGLTEYGDG